MWGSSVTTSASNLRQVWGFHSCLERWVLAAMAAMLKRMGHHPLEA